MTTIVVAVLVVDTGATGRPSTLILHNSPYNEHQKKGPRPRLYERQAALETDPPHFIVVLFRESLLFMELANFTEWG
jgi:hypothetical protein